MTNSGQDKMATIFQTTISYAFSWLKRCQFRLKFLWSCFPKGLINNIPALTQITDWRQPGDNSLSETMTVRLPTHICDTRPQWVKRTLSFENIRRVDRFKIYPISFPRDCLTTAFVYREIKLIYAMTMIFHTVQTWFTGAVTILAKNMYAYTRLYNFSSQQSINVECQFNNPG